jgi:hypothetical protein
MDEGCKRVIGIMASILASLHMQTADDLYGTPEGSPRTDKLIAAWTEWAEQIMKKIDRRFGRWNEETALAVETLRVLLRNADSVKSLRP